MHPAMSPIVGRPIPPSARPAAFITYPHVGHMDAGTITWGVSAMRFVQFVGFGDQHGGQRASFRWGQTEPADPLLEHDLHKAALTVARNRHLPRHVALFFDLHNLERTPIWPPRAVAIAAEMAPLTGRTHQDVAALVAGLLAGPAIELILCGALEHRQRERLRHAGTERLPHVAFAGIASVLVAEVVERVTEAILILLAEHLGVALVMPARQVVAHRVPP